ncbi:hypothetical protein FRC01_000204 [Tulasnella sp. 417]|nr:hypothetical protein FRC01_000204 [Tulasnella sp. 417]
MQENKDGNHASDRTNASDSGQGDFSGAFLHNSKLRNKLKRLARWRIDPSLIEFPKDAHEFRGGFATVSRAFFTPSPNVHKAGNEPAPTADEHPDPEADNLQPGSDTQELTDNQRGKDEESEGRTTGDGEHYGGEDKGKEPDTHEKRVNSPTSAPKARDEPESSEHSALGDAESGDRNLLPQGDTQGHGDNHQGTDEGADSRTPDGDNDQANDSEEEKEESTKHQEQGSHPHTIVSAIGDGPLSSQHSVDEDPDGSTNVDLNPQCQNVTQGPGDKERNKDEEPGSHVADIGNSKTVEEQNFESPQQKLVVAVKKLKIEGDMDLERVLGLALRESEFLVELSHPNIVKLKGFVESVSARKVWLIFPWEEHGNLRDFLASGEWEIPERISLINDVTLGLEYLHSQEPPIYHGDLKSAHKYGFVTKPECFQLNILVDSDFHALITDFGSARHLGIDHGGKQQKENEHKPRPASHPATSEEQITLEALFSATASTLTLTGSSYTLRWAAPELLQDDKPCLRSDIWALGWIAYEVMTNTIPFHDIKKDAIVIKRVIQGHLPSVTQDARMSLIRALCSLMVKCWNFHPDKRPTAAECRKLISWMPMIVPAPIHTVDDVASQLRRAQLLNKLGLMYSRQADYASARNCVTEALNLYTINDDSLGRAETLRSLADLHIPRYELNQAVTLYSEALQIYADVGDEMQKANVIYGLAETHRVQAEYDEAGKLYTECLQLFTKVGGTRGRAMALAGLADAHRSREQYAEAMNLYSDALQIFTDVGDETERATTLWGLAEVQGLQHHYDAAIKLYSEAAQVFTALGNRDWNGETLFNLAQVHQMQGHYSEALSCYTQASEAFIEIGKLSRASDASTNAAAIRTKIEGVAGVSGGADVEGSALASDSQYYSEAIELYSQALQIYTDVGDRGERALTMWGLAEVHRNRREYDEAINLCSEASQIYTDVGDRQERARTLFSLAEAYRSQAQYSEARKLYAESLQVYTNMGNKEGRGIALWGLGEVHRIFHEYDEATNLLSEARQIFTSVGDNASRAETLISLALNSKMRSQPSEAVLFHTEASEVREEMGNSRRAAEMLKIAAGIRKTLKEATADPAQTLEVKEDTSVTLG